MASFSTISIRFNLDLKQFSSQMQNAQRSMRKYGQQMQRVGSGLTLGITLPVLGLGAATVKAASDAEETASKFGTVFRDISTAAENSAKTLRESYGLSSRASKELLGDTGDLLTGFGFSQDAALDLSTEVNKLAVDLASFTNYSGGAKGASEAITKALLGERESVKSLGISILEADVQAKILQNTQEGLTFETNRQAKAFATLQLAQDQSKNAIGDYARTNKSFANQMRLIKARVEDVAVQFGEILLPYMTKLANSAGELIEKFSNLEPSTKKIIVVVAGLAAAVGPLLVGLGFLLTTVIPGLVTAFGVLSAAMAATPFGAIAAAVGLAAGAIVLLSRETDKASKNQSVLSQVTKKAADSISEERAKVEELLFIARDENVSKKQRIKAIRELNKISPKYLGNLDLEKINTDAARKAVDEYNKSLIKTAKVKAAQEKLQEIQSKMIEKELELSSRRQKIAEQESKMQKGAADNAASAALATEQLARAKGLLAIETENGNASLKEQEKLLLNIIKDFGSGNVALETDSPEDNKKGKGNRNIVESVNEMNALPQIISPLDALEAKLPEQSELIKNTFDGFKNGMVDISGALNNALESSIGSTAQFMGDFVGNIITGQASAKDALSGLMSIVAGFMESLGQAMIAAGVASEAFKDLFASGIGAIVAGTALIALAGVVKSIMKSGPSGSSGGGNRRVALANGGIAYGPTNALIGEYSGASNNPEVVAPLDKLRSMISDSAGASDVNVSGGFVLRGNDLLASIDRSKTRKNRRGA